MKLKEARTEIDSLKERLGKAYDEITGLKGELTKADMAKGQTLALSLEKEKQAKILKIITLISEGKGAEAIKELLEPMPVVIGLDIRYADEETAVKAEEERFENMKTRIIDAVKSARLIHNKNGDKERTVWKKP